MNHNKQFFLVAATIVLVTFCFAFLYQREQFGVASSVTSSDTVSTLRLAVNDLIKLATSFSTTTSNTYTAAQTFSAGFVNSATSTGTFGIALTGGCFSQNGVCLSASGSSVNSSSSNITVSNFFQFPFSATQAPTAAGAIAFDTTDNQLKIGDGSATQVFTQYRYLVFPYSTTTTWTGTTTLTEIRLPDGMTFDSAQCTVSPMSATLNAQIQYGPSPTLLTMFNASNTASAASKMSFTSSNVPAAGATTTIKFGTPVGTPTGVSCTVKTRVTGT